MKIDLGRFVEKAGPLRVLGVKVTKDGELVGEHLFEEECRRNLYSASKSYTSCAVGFAVQEGLIDISQPLTEAFKEDLPEQVSPNLEKATVKDLLTMNLGQEKGSLMGGQRPRMKEKDWVKYSLSLPFVAEPDTQFVYNNVGPYLAGMLVQRRTGRKMNDYLHDRLLQYMDIPYPTWEMDPLGYTFGAGGLFLTLSEFHKFGLFYLNDGSVDGRQLLDREWIRESTKKQVENNVNEYGYGYLFWGTEHGGFRADGKYCQYSIILRKENAVITMVSECRDGKALDRAIFDEIWPQLV